MQKLLTDAVVESLTAFANSSGGRVLVGVDDGGKPVKGFTLGSESLQKWVNDIKNKTQPSIIPDADEMDLAGTKVGVLSVKEFPVKPVAFKGRYYKRVNNANHQLSLTEIADLHLRSFNTVGIAILIRIGHSMTYRWIRS
ncbi:helix-turn-helix domain-containing protein [Parapedobacter sp. GCM10030251]|uniref:AlbA family DNA-binding domain-containing protein n=1 Tax=Parapedobacter sp. GCM10030251 TaxID=3273419 RepID=UPI00361F577B